jgi:hypothetical protein
MNKIPRIIALVHIDLRIYFWSKLIDEELAPQTSNILNPASVGETVQNLISISIERP